MIALLLAAFPAAYVVRTNIPELKGQVVEVGQVLTVPRASPERDYWFTLRYYATCAEDTHINSRDDEEVRVTVKEVPAGSCDDPIWR